MKTDIVTLVIFVFCLGVLISALDLGRWFGDDESGDPASVLLQQADNS